MMMPLFKNEIKEWLCIDCGKEVKAEHRPEYGTMERYDSCYHRWFPRRLKDFTADDLEDLRHRG